MRVRKEGREKGGKEKKKERENVLWYGWKKKGNEPPENWPTLPRLSRNFKTLKNVKSRRGY